MDIATYKVYLISGYLKLGHWLTLSHERQGEKDWQKISKNRT